MSTDPRYLESTDPMPAEPGAWVYAKTLAPGLDGRIPVAAPDGLAPLGSDGIVPPAHLPLPFVPTFIPDGQSFLIPANTQALYALPITLGTGATLVVAGHLLEIAP